MTYKPTPTKTYAGEKYVVGRDTTVADILREILRQITIANAQLATMTEDQYDTEINEDPTEESF